MPARIYPFGLGDIQTQQLFLAVPIDAQSKVNHLVVDLDFIADFDLKSVRVEDRINRTEWVGMLGFYLIKNDRGDVEDECRRNVHNIQLFKMPLNFAVGQSSGIEEDDFIVETRNTTLVFGDELWLKLAVAITGHFQGYFALVAFECFMAGAITGIATTSTL